MTLSIKHTLGGTEISLITGIDDGKTIRKNQFLPFNWLSLETNTPKYLAETLGEMDPESINYLQIPPETDCIKGIILDFSDVIAQIRQCESHRPKAHQMGGINYFIQWLTLTIFGKIRDMESCSPPWIGIYDPSENRIVLPWHNRWNSSLLGLASFPLTEQPAGKIGEAVAPV